MDGSENGITSAQDLPLEVAYKSSGGRSFIELVIKHPYKEQ